VATILITFRKLLKYYFPENVYRTESEIVKNTLTHSPRPVFRWAEAAPSLNRDRSPWVFGYARFACKSASTCAQFQHGRVTVLQHGLVACVSTARRSCSVLICQPEPFRSCAMYECGSFMPTDRLLSILATTVKRVGQRNNSTACRGVATGVYRYIYPPKISP